MTLINTYENTIILHSVLEWPSIHTFLYTWLNTSLNCSKTKTYQDNIFKQSGQFVCIPRQCDNVKHFVNVKEIKIV